MIDLTDASLEDLSAAIVEAIEWPTLGQRSWLERLRQDTRRLQESRFQLAVLGQFKRGKSTLLNAFIGSPLLSTGVLPLTAVPTFLFGAPRMRIRLCRAENAAEERQPQSFEELTAMIAAATTEEQNPRNTKALERVEVGLPSTPWLNDVTLIDTPGVGSTHQHNTDTARAILPECDAALFVVSVDPLITDVEVQYLATICRTVAHVIVVLNKADLVDHSEGEKALAFLANILSQLPEPQIDRRIFPISARRALDARRAGDVEALRASGLPALEDYIRSKLLGAKQAHLSASIARKMSDILAALTADAALTANALAVPLAELDERIAIFERSAAAFAKERDHLEDLLSSEWRRALRKLDLLCEDAHSKVSADLEMILVVSGAPQPAQTSVHEAMSKAFAHEFDIIATGVNADLSAAVETHQRGFLGLAQKVREAAAALMDVRVAGAVPHDWFQVNRKPYWVGDARTESLGSITTDWLTKCLPISYQRQRAQRQLREGVARAITRNISTLHWTMRQNIDDSFRRLLVSANHAVDSSIASTREVLTAARERRKFEDKSLQKDIQRAQAVTFRLEELARALFRHLPRA